MKAGIAVAAAVAAFAVGSTAQAAVVAQLGSTAGYTALPGEINDVVVTRDGTDVVFEDRGGGAFVTGPGCRPDGQRVARCSGTLTLHLTLDDGNDHVIARTELHATVDGGAGDDWIATGPAADEIRGGPGDDVMDGGPGGDVISGGSGIDTADYAGRKARVIVTLDLLPNDGEQGEGDTLEGTEQVVGGSGGDILVGDDGPNALYGGPGDDALAGRGGEDVLVGGPGKDGINAGDPSGAAAASGADAPRDTVVCGGDRDRVFGDSRDSVDGDCESVDRSGTLGYAATSGAGPDPPEVGRSVVVRPISGVILIVPQTSTDPNTRLDVPASPPVPLDDERNIPIGSVVDTRLGTVEMTTAVDRAGKVQRGQFHSGPFQVFQREADGATADLALRGGKSFAICGRQSGPGRPVFAARAKRRKGKLIRRLWADAKGRFRTGGRFAAATVRGTRWLTEDRCEGTLVRVARGTVVVHDAVLDRDVEVNAGERYLARAP